jgi:hypothetical protein
MTPRDLITCHTLTAGIVLALALILCPGVTPKPTAHATANPITFDAQGTLDAINPATDYISINDTAYRLAPNPLFFTHPRRPIPPSAFKPGDTVAFILDEHQRVKVLWRMKY